VGSLTLQLKQEGDSLAARGEYEAAAVKYQAAVNQEPEDVSLRFALGTALSHLGRRQETIEQFRRVVARGDPHSPEFRAALQWLVSAGEMVERVASAPARSARAPSRSGGKVKGRTGWEGVDPKEAEARTVLVYLLGDEASNRGTEFHTYSKLGQPFEIDKVAPGTYRLIAQVSGEPVWDQTVTVGPGEEVVLDLTRPNSLIPSGALPGENPDRLGS
jgi:tetratricopeptide (TPR) repeat protein